MNQGKPARNLSGNEKPSLASGKKSFSNNCVVPDDEEQMNYLSSDIEVDEMPIVLESVGSHDDMMTSHHDQLMVDQISRDEGERNFFSSEYGPIISAAQSTTILYSATELTASLLMDNGSENSQINLHGKGFAKTIVVNTNPHFIIGTLDIALTT